MKNFDRDFNRTSKLIQGVFIFIAIVIISMFVFGVLMAFNVITNPEGMGEFFGKIVSGFQSVNK